MLAAQLLRFMAVFNAFVISTALALSLGHTATLLCQVWCQPVAAAEAHCHEDAQVSATATLSQAPCCEIAAAPAVFTSSVRSHVPVDAGAVTLVSPLPPLASYGSAVHGHALELSPPLERRPRITVLRI